MNVLVTYKSKTEFTKWYAEIIAKGLEADLAEFSEVTAEKMSGYDVIVYGGGLYAGRVNGFKKAKEMFATSTAKKLVVFATGATPNVVTDKVDEVWQTNLTEEERATIPHFYMQSGLCYEKMSFADKTIMKMLANMLSKKADKSKEEEGQEQAIKSSYNSSDEKYAQPLIDFVLGK